MPLLTEETLFPHVCHARRTQCKKKQTDEGWEESMNARRGYLVVMITVMRVWEKCICLSTS
ncbi:hypothetical protein HanIR_Chr11g0533821 [Helianthus annuus]|nr:hypothetical protein HanIR_Chr11g0533821 [Helianthus annuus]